MMKLKSIVIVLLLAFVNCKKSNENIANTTKPNPVVKVNYKDFLAKIQQKIKTKNGMGFSNTSILKSQIIGKKHLGLSAELRANRRKEALLAAIL